MSEWPEFTLCVLPTEDLTDMQKWILEHGDRYDLGELTMNQQIALGAELESWIPDLKEALEEERKIEEADYE